jgi:hypothetical protein
MAIIAKLMRPGGRRKAYTANTFKVTTEGASKFGGDMGLDSFLEATRLP